MKYNLLLLFAMIVAINTESIKAAYVKVPPLPKRPGEAAATGAVPPLPQRPTGGQQKPPLTQAWIEYIKSYASSNNLQELEEAKAAFDRDAVPYYLLPQEAVTIMRGMRTKIEKLKAAQQPRQPQGGRGARGGRRPVSVGGGVRVPTGPTELSALQDAAVDAAMKVVEAGRTAGTQEGNNIANFWDKLFQ